jgi:hypothetical protein
MCPSSLLFSTQIPTVEWLTAVISKIFERATHLFTYDHVTNIEGVKTHLSYLNTKEGVL